MYVLKKKSNYALAHNCRLKTQCYFMTAIFTQQKESPEKFSITFF